MFIHTFVYLHRCVHTLCTAPFGNNYLKKIRRNFNQLHISPGKKKKSTAAGVKEKIYIIIGTFQYNKQVLKESGTAQPGYSPCWLHFLDGCPEPQV